MQMKVIEFARNKLNMKNATSSEFGASKASVVGLMSEWTKDGKLMRGTDKNLGGTMRLGSYEARLKKDTKVSKIYNTLKIYERHRHRYEVNINYKEEFENKGNDFFRFISRQQIARNYRTSKPSLVYWRSISSRI